MPNGLGCCPIFTDLYEGAKNAKNTREIRVESKGKTQDTNAPNSIHVQICSAWLERPSPIESPRERP